MGVTQIKKEKEPAMQPPLEFSTKVSRGQGTCTGVNNRRKEEDESYFYDFDVSEESFAVDQIWAIYDPLDGMPRYYARIDKVYSPFQVDVTWLEFIAGDMDETAWKRSGLPVACGNFKLGDTDSQIIEDTQAFSHKIFDEISARKIFNIYPRKGETWAIYKNWNIKWSSDPDNHRKYKYEFVEVLSDYTSKAGILVSYLVKVKGFNSLFKPTKNNGMTSFQIPSNEMLRFSHRVHSFRTNGTERKDIPEGYFELDPYSVPRYYAEEVVEDDDHYKQESESESINVATPDFYNFDLDKREECFEVDQVWANFDELDAMPRYYARIDKVYSPFKVDITWLEFFDGNTDEKVWKTSGLPVACGKFKLGKSCTVDYISSFSHKIFGGKGVTKSYTIYPEKGETWALYKNWNIKWSSDPKNHREYEYEFVEVLSDFTNKSGILVAHLVKLEGFVCLFKPAKSNGMASFQIPSNEMLRFSHRVPSFRTNGKEREDVPEGYFELDPCSLPSNLKEIPETLDGNIGSPKSVSKEKPPLPKKRKNSDAESTLDGSSPGGIKSSRMSDGRYKNSNEEKRATEASGRPLDKSKPTNVSDCEKNAAAHSKEMNPDGVLTMPGNADEDIPSSPCSLNIFEMRDTEFWNFDKERSYEKFKTGQIWALYCKLDNLPKNYARIESVESYPVFKLAIKWLKSCDPPRDIISWVDKELPVSCGTFKVTSRVVAVFTNSVSFSHQLSEVPAVNNVYTIYPRAGEVWAVYSKFHFDLTCSDLKKCAYHIVEILEVVDVHWIIVSVLERVTGFKTVFKVKEKEGLDSPVAIPWIELYRFSHQVPAFMLSGARYGKLRGCWELDSRSLAVF